MVCARSFCFLQAADEGEGAGVIDGGKVGSSVMSAAHVRSCQPLTLCAAGRNPTGEFIGMIVKMAWKTSRTLKAVNPFVRQV